MSYLAKNTNLVALVVVLLSVSACSSMVFKADPKKVDTIKSVAVVSFTVPAFVTEEAGSGQLAGFTALMGMVKTMTSDKKGQLGNGREVAKDAVVGFIEEMSSSGQWNILPMRKVIANSTLKPMVSTYDQAKKDITTSLEGTPAMSLKLDGKYNEYAAKAAKALGVDGVMMVDIDSMEYFLYTGAAGTGQAKAKGNASFKLYDRNGNPVWESAAVVWTEASATMVAGALNPAQAPKLHKSIGADLATDLLKRYRENARK